MSISSITNRPLLFHFGLWLLSFAIIFGPAFSLMDTYHYDYTINPDIQSYIGLAEFDFDQSSVRKYRIIVPMLASLIDTIFGVVFHAIAPNTFSGPDFSLCFSFLLVNSTIISLCGIFIFKLCYKYTTNILASLLGMLSMLSCRWTGYVAGLPLTDSLYLLCIVLILYAITSKENKYLYWAILIGPWAKESFILFLPFILIYAPKSRLKLLATCIGSVLTFILFRQYLDQFSSSQDQLGVHGITKHLGYISYSLNRLFSWHGIYELFSISGLWTVFILAGINIQKIRESITLENTFYWLIFSSIILVHALLSTELARMFYFGIPMISFFVASSTSALFTQYCKQN